MPLLLTILSVIAAVAFLLVLQIGLLLIMKTLQNIKRYLQQIAMGVRAIETQTIPLESHAVALHSAAFDASRTLASTAAKVSGLGRVLDTAGDGLNEKE
jgi:uncharacterized protein YoxC